jgi:hypothetical protein
MKKVNTKDFNTILVEGGPGSGRRPGGGRGPGGGKRVYPKFSRKSKPAAPWATSSPKGKGIPSIKEIPTISLLAKLNAKSVKPYNWDKVEKQKAARWAKKEK